MGEPRTVVDRYYRCFETGDLAAGTACFAPGCETVTPAGAMPPPEHEAFSGAFKAALPNGRMEILKSVESGDEIFIEGRLHGTHSGDLVSPQGTIPASGNEVELPFADYFRIADGKIVEHHVFWDQGAMLAQLGVTGQ